MLGQAKTSGRRRYDLLMLFMFRVARSLESLDKGIHMSQSRL